MYRYQCFWVLLNMGDEQTDEVEGEHSPMLSSSFMETGTRTDLNLQFSRHGK